VRAADEERALDGFADEELLALAVAEGRVLVTFDVKDFPIILRRWAEAERSHAGCAIVVGIDHGEFGTIIRTVERELQTKPQQTAWVNYTLFVARA
jgi:hypothetical protein